MGAGPIDIRHLGAIGPEPVDILDVGAVDGAALEEVAAAEDGLGAAEIDERANKFEEVEAFGIKCPIDP